MREILNWKGNQKSAGTSNYTDLSKSTGNYNSSIKSKNVREIQITHNLLRIEMLTQKSAGNFKFDQMRHF